MLHHHMVVRELEQFFGTDDPSQGITDTAEFTTNDRSDSLCQDSRWTQDSFFYSRLNWNVNIHTSEGFMEILPCHGLSQATKQNY